MIKTIAIEEMSQKDVSRFWSRVQKTEGCWYWTASINYDGYGVFYFNKRLWKAHRIAFRLIYGVDLGSNFGCHTCDARNCIRPEHVFPGTSIDNVHDMISKGRSFYQKNPRRFSTVQIRYSDDIAEAIRVAYQNGEGSTRMLAERFGLSKSQVQLFIHGKRR